jgi:hypothetical protein
MICVWYAVLALPSVIILWELLSGKSLNREWKVSAYREIDPRTYWTDVALQVALLGAAYTMIWWVRRT